MKVCIWHCVLAELWDTAFNKIIGLFSDIGLAFNSIRKWGEVSWYWFFKMTSHAVQYNYIPRQLLNMLEIDPKW